MISFPIRVPRMPRSCRMGRSVPMAVVVSAMTTARPSSSKADSVGPNGHDDERDGEGDRPGDGAALPLRAGEALRRYLVAGEKEQEGEAQIGQQVDGVGRLNGTEP